MIMESTHIDACLKRLPDVFHLLLDSSKTIVDDTCVEKLLTLIENITQCTDDRMKLFKEDVGLVSFLSHVVTTSCEPCTMTFALKLNGILLKHDDTVQLLAAHFTGIESSLEHRIFQRALEGIEYWLDASVRCAWLNSMKVNLNYAYQVITQLECIEQIIACLVDASMFVITAAQDFTVSLIVWCYKHGMLAEREKVALVKKSQLDNGKEKHAIDEKSSRCLETHSGCRETSSSSSFIGERLLQYMTKVLRSDSTIEKPEIVSVLQMLRKLFETDQSVGGSVAMETYLLASCQDMVINCDAGVCANIVELFIVIARKTRTSDWIQMDDIIVMIMSLMHHGKLSPALKLTTTLLLEMDQQHEQHNRLYELVFLPLDFCLHPSPSTVISSSTVDFIMAAMKSRGTCISLVMHSIMALQRQCTKGGRLDDDKLCRFLKYPIILLPITSSPDRQNLSTQYTKHLLGNTKLTKFLLDLALTLCDVYAVSDDDLYQLSGVVVKMVDNPHMDSTVICKSLKTITAILRQSTSSESESGDELVAKKPRLQDTEACSQPSDLILSKVFFNILQKRSYDTRWDVRDSVINFITDITQLSDNRNVVAWIVESKLGKEVWEKLRDDDDSYVRASSLFSLAQMSLCEELWLQFMSTCEQTMQSVVQTVTNVLLHDTEAFPRRAAVDVFLKWLTKHPQIRSYLLSSNYSTYKIGHKVEEDAGESNTEHRSVFSIMLQASHDLDFEVKLSVLNFWEVIIHHYLPCFATKNLTESIWDELYHIQKTGCLEGLQSSSDDHDRVVAEKACTILITLKELIVKGLDGKDKNALTVKHKLDIKFIDFLLKTDLDRILSEKSRSVDIYEWNPLALIDDMLYSSESNDDNLLDCY
ncbi:integrator complex assembly factor BRAT1-like [Saccoglossus kowalevskii]|uniref:BRCA1-associated ATM activator 1-like n=1 Tax=Saccoglossus kowalevskii TaxID=10224 RepID=A0ABM0M407_SACKO|nr:PREDICTED: BRCA1-associated ATM activator 1-like [Saccoglossus kowalevskii]